MIERQCQRLAKRPDVPAFIVGSTDATVESLLQRYVRGKVSLRLSAEQFLGQTEAGMPADVCVIDELPAFDPESASIFSDRLDAAVAAGVQILVVCQAVRDVFADLQSDRLYIIVDEEDADEEATRQGLPPSDYGNRCNGQPEPPLHLRLLGDFKLYCEGQELDCSELEREKVRLLVSLVALPGEEGIERSALLHHLWPRLTEKRQLNNFYVTLSRLNSALNRVLTESGGRQMRALRFFDNRFGRVSVDRRGLECDVHRFHAAAERLRTDDLPLAQRIAFGEDALRYYSGDVFLGRGRSELVSAWQEYYHDLHITVLERLALLYTGQNRFDSAMDKAMRALELEPAREDIYYLKMQLEAQIGRRVSAIQTYLKCQRYLHQELGLKPSRRISHFYEQLRDDSDCTEHLREIGAMGPLG
jgi:DNA-binding SARP family transcriptional activator